MLRAECLWRWWAGLVPLLLLAASLTATTGLTYISSLNYPGGHAMQALHSIEVMQLPVFFFTKNDRDLTEFLYTVDC